MPQIAIAAKVIWTVVKIAIAVASIAYSRNQAQKAKKALQNALNRSSIGEARGILQQFRGTAVPRRTIYGRHRIGAYEVYFATSGTNNEYMHYIFYWSEGPCGGVEKIFLDDEQVPFDEDGNAQGKWAGHVKIVSNTGAAGQTAIADAVSEMPGWATTDKGLGTCHSWMRFKYSDTVFPNGLPSVSAVVQGRNDIYDLRTETTGYSDNPALCFAHWLSTQRTGPALDYDGALGQADLIESANICDELVSLSTGGSEKRYTFNGIVKADEEPESVIESFRTSMAGYTVDIGGRKRIYAGAYYTPTLTLNEDMIVGPVELETKVSKRDRYNTVKGVYASELMKWQPTDFVAYADADGLTADGEELVTDIELLNTASPTMCRRIAKIDALRARYAKKFTATFNVEALQALTGKPVLLNFARYGFVNKPMDVVRWGFVIEDNKIMVPMTLQETDPSIYSWTTAEDKADEVSAGTASPIQDPNQCSPVTVDPPGGNNYDDDIDNVTLSCATIGATIYYQVVDYKAAEGVSWTTYTAPFTINHNDSYSGRSLWVYATKSPLTDSAHSRYDFEMDPYEPSDPD